MAEKISRLAKWSNSDKILSKNEFLLLILILFFGAVLRIIIASNTTPVEDEMIHGVHAIGVSKLAPLSTLTQAPVWQYLTDYFYRILGISLLTSRILSVIFGSLSIIVVYLLSNMLFNKRAGLLAAFLLAVSAFHITWTASYQDQTMMFFVLLAAYFFIKAYKTEKKISLASALFLGIAELIKIITGVFILVFGIFAIIIIYNNFKNDKKLFKTNLFRLGISFVILFIFLAPIILHNVFLFKSKGIVDQPIAQFLKVNSEFYTGPGLHHGEGFVLNKISKNLYSIITVYFLKEDPIIFLIGLAGLIYLIIYRFKQEQNFELLFLISLCLFALLVLASTIVLQTHYTSFMPLFAIFGSFLILKWLSKINIEKTRRITLLIFLVILGISSLWSIHDPMTSQSATQKLRSFADSSIDSNTLVIVDSRIYTGTYTWMFNDKHYINAQYLPELMRQTSNVQFVPVKSIFVECVNDDCGWGTIKDQPELNKSMEQLIEQFKNVSIIKSFEGGGSIKSIRGAEIRRSPFYKIYETSLYLNPSTLPIVDQTHNHFFYRIPRNMDSDKAYDYYVVDGFFNLLLRDASKLILYLSIFLSMVAIFIPFYLVYKSNINGF